MSVVHFQMSLTLLKGSVIDTHAVLLAAGGHTATTNGCNLPPSVETVANHTAVERHEGGVDRAAFIIATAKGIAVLVEEIVAFCQ